MKTLQNKSIGGRERSSCSADCGPTAACDFGTPSFARCYVMPKLPSCFINLRGTTAGVTTVTAGELAACVNETTQLED